MRPQPRALDSNASSATDATPQPAAPAEGCRGARQRQGSRHVNFFHREGVDLEQAIAVSIYRGHGNRNISCGKKLIVEPFQACTRIIHLNGLQSALLISSGTITGINFESNIIR
jgi:hypothetical protein